MVVDLSKIPNVVLILILITRFISFIMLIAVINRMWNEYFKSKDGAKQTKRLLLILGISFFIGSLVSFIQIGCFYFMCLAITLIPTTIFTAINNLLSIIILFVIYFTKETVQQSNVNIEMQKSLKTIGQQTKRAEVRSDDIDKNTALGVGKTMKGVTREKKTKSN